MRADEPTIARHERDTKIGDKGVGEFIEFMSPTGRFWLRSADGRHCDRINTPKYNEVPSTSLAEGACVLMEHETKFELAALTLGMNHPLAQVTGFIAQLSSPGPVEVVKEP